MYAKQLSIWLLIGFIGLAVVITGLSLLNGVSPPLLVIGALELTLFSLATVGLFLMGLKGFKHELRRAYGRISAGIVVYGLGPEGWVTETKFMDARPGGTWHYRMHGNGAEVWGFAEYEAVEEPHRIAYTESASNAAGEKQTGKQQVTTISLTSEDNERTAISISTRFASLADLETMVRMGMAKGYAGALDKLETIIKKEQHGTY